jgi:hypothetical protein
MTYDEVNKRKAFQDTKKMSNDSLHDLLSVHDFIFFQIQRGTKKKICAAYPHRFKKNEVDLVKMKYVFNDITRQ